ncbi:MAG: 50S ribosomal protein L3 [Gemmataceae bacterium]|nr:50S ribosomal protein L3 [Gemmataceae bacterium]
MTHEAALNGPGVTMSLGLLGTKIGMTQVFTPDGTVEPVTVLQVGPCPVLQIKYPTSKGENGAEEVKDGYAAVQLGYKDKSRKRATRPEQGHVAANLKSKRKEARLKAGVILPPKADCEPQRFIREFRLDRAGAFITKLHEIGPAEARITVERIRVSGEGASKKYEAYTEDMTLKVGQVLTLMDVFKDVPAVDVTGTSKGRGTAGVMKRHGFAGLPASHGAKKVHRQAGSTASHASNRGSGRPKKGQRRAGRYGHERVTIRNLSVVKIDPDNHLMLVRGGIPGPNGGLVLVRPTNKVGPGSPKAKTRKLEAPAKTK